MADTSLFDQVLEWIKQQKPLYFRVTDYVGSAVKQNWPIISTWSVHCAKSFMWVSGLWLECSLRGLNSLLQLSSTTYFLLLWCSFLSMTSISGLLYVIISSGIACLAGLLLGFAPAIFITAILGATIMWMYGSFWITGALIIIGGSLFTLNHAQLAILITTVYSMYCAKVRGGWLGLILCMNMAFISNDVLIHLLKVSVKEDEKECVDDRAEESKRKNFCNGHGSSSSNGKQRKSPKSSPTGESSCGQFVPKHEESPTSKSVEEAPSIGEEVLRIKSSSDYYETLGLSRYENIDFAVLKRMYKKKAILVHPDKNMGNPVAEESFKKLQSAYEVLSDLTKKNTYDMELKTEELSRSLHQNFRSGVQKGMDRPTNTKKATFHENAAFRGKKTAHESSRRPRCSGYHSMHMDLEDLMMEEFYLWNLMQSGDFDIADYFSEFTGTGSIYSGKNYQKRRARRQW